MSKKTETEYLRRKNVKHAKDALGHMKSFDDSQLSIYHKENVSVIRMYLVEIVRSLEGK